MLTSLPTGSSRARKRVPAALMRLRVQLSVLLLALLIVSPGSRTAAADPTPQPSPTPPLTQSGLEPTSAGLAERDSNAASQQAGASGQRVEIVDARTDYGRTWALPQGGFESESTGAPVRFRDAAAPGGWRDVDTTLVSNPDGTVSPKAVPQPLVLGAFGDAADHLVSVTTQGQSLTFGSGIEASLPKPVLEGSTARYTDVLPGVDVTVEARSTGFEQLWIAKDRAALNELLSTQAGGDQGVSASVDTDGLAATPQPDGSVTFTDAAKNTVSKVPAPTVWDATTAPDGTPAAEVDADLNVLKAGSVVADKKTVAGDNLDLSVTLDQAWLDDPARRYPITIDPTYTAGADKGPIFDTYVKEGATTDRSDSTYLPVGYGLDNVQNRSFMDFDNLPFQGLTISAASLSLWADNSGTCIPSGWSAYDADLASAASRWTYQPARGAKYATSTQTKGFSSACADGRVSIDMTSQLQAWSKSADEVEGVALIADNETSVNGYHRFWSSDASANLPVLRWTWKDAAAPGEAPTASDQSTVAQYYQSKEAIGQGAQPSAVNTTSVQASASVGSAYFQDWYAAYADDPDLTIKGLSITPTVLSKTTSGSLVNFEVSVRITFQLHDNRDGSDFTGGETVDHVVQADTNASTTNASAKPASGTSSQSTILGDTALDVSTAPTTAVAGDAEDTELARMSSPAAPLPTWQAQLKQTNNDPAGSTSASRVSASSETGGSVATEDNREAADLANTPPTGDDPTTSDYSADSSSRAASTNYFPQLRWQDAANYASLWTDDNHANKINTKYGDAGDNCTNFVSQALYAGGYKTRNTTGIGRKWISRWHWNYVGPGHFTYTWSRAHYNYRRLLNVGNRPTFSNIYDAGLADLGYFDWDVGGATANDGTMDHVMIVSKRTKSYPYWSQKSGNRHNAPPSEVRRNIGNHTFKFYGVRT